MRYHDGVDDEDETYHKTEWSLPPCSPHRVFNVGVILVNIITLILLHQSPKYPMADSDLKLEREI